MKTLRTCAFLLMTIVAFGACLRAEEAAPAEPGKQEPTVTEKLPPAGLETNHKQFSYMMGVNVGMQMKQQGLDLDLNALARGLADAMGGVELAFTPEELNLIAKNFFENKQKADKARGEENLKKQQAFLAENGKKPGIKTTASGLQYQVLKEGTGVQPTIKDEVTVHYKGTLLSGKEFDSSYNRGEPTTFELGRLIPGWKEGIALMKAGAKYRFWVPSKIGYGERGAGGDIGPNELLIFDVELFKVKAPGLLNPIKK